MSLPAAGVTASLPEAAMDPAGLARGQTPGAAAARVPGSVSAKPAWPSLIPGQLTPIEYELRARQIQPIA